MASFGYIWLLATSQGSYLSCVSQINSTHAVLTEGKNNPGWMTIVTREGEVAVEEPVLGHGCLPIPGGLMIAGGFQGNYTTFSSKTIIYNFKTEKWDKPPI